MSADLSLSPGAAGYLAAADPRRFVAANNGAVAVVVAALVVAVGVLIAVVVHRGARHGGKRVRFASEKTCPPGRVAVPRFTPRGTPYTECS